MRILVTGGTGMVGSALRSLTTEHKLTFCGSSQYDLRDERQAADMIFSEKPDAIVHLAARVGGIKGNTDFVADFFHENVLINTNVLCAAHNHGIEKVVSLLSTCVYPNDVTYPLTEDQIHNGPPHASNFGYAYAKRMLDVHSRALRQQYGRNYICAVPNNLYGPCDNFDLENGHVIPAIIRKIWDAKITKVAPTFWGDGTALREFTFSRDIGRALIYLLEQYNSSDPINIGLPNEMSIKTIVTLVCEELSYTGPVAWDKSKPSGQFRKPSCNKNFLKLGWDSSSYTSIKVGIKETCHWFMSEYPDIRGINR
jgi:GDP-L-fucose synthase